MCRSNNRNRCFLGPAGADAARGEAATTVGTASKTAVTNKATTTVTTMQLPVLGVVAMPMVFPVVAAPTVAAAGAGMEETGAVTRMDALKGC